MTRMRLLMPPALVRPRRRPLREAKAPAGAADRARRVRPPGRHAAGWRSAASVVSIEVLGAGVVPRREDTAGRKRHGAARPSMISTRRRKERLRGAGGVGVRARARRARGAD